MARVDSASLMPVIPGLDNYRGWLTLSDYPMGGGRIGIAHRGL